MSVMPVPDEAIEAAVSAYETVRCNGKRASVRSGIEAALTAAAPIIRAQGEREHLACSCYACDPPRAYADGFPMSRMYLCSECGNKRCPHAADHRYDCTGSNEAGQEGSLYPPVTEESRAAARAYFADIVARAAAEREGGTR